MAASQKDTNAQKQDFERLLKATLPFAEHMLTNHGEFYPYGATMERTGKITSVGGYTGNEHPNSTEVIDLLKGAFRAQAKTNGIMACALAYDIRTVPPGQTEKTDAIAIALDHRDGLSVVMVYAYKIGTERKIQLAPPFATKGEGEIFKAKLGDRGSE